mgnify:CR=1 FL=1
MGFKFASFGAATVPLSKIVIDKALDMGEYPLIGQKIMAPYRPYTWETVPFPYDDRSPTTLMTGISKNFYNKEVLVLTWTCDTPKACYVRAIIPTGSSGCTSVKDARIVINGETVYTTGSWVAGTTKTTDAIAIAPGEVFELYASNAGGTYGSCITNCTLVETGYEAPVNMDLKGRFLALDQDFGELTATLTFGDEADVPFSDYPNRFPYAPDKITFNRHALENRPVINLYKGV